MVNTAVNTISILCLAICALVAVPYLADASPAYKDDTPTNKTPQKQVQDVTTNSPPHFTKKHIVIGIIVFMLLCAKVVLKWQRVAHNKAQLTAKPPIARKKQEMRSENNSYNYHYYSPGELPTIPEKEACNPEITPLKHKKTSEESFETIDISPLLG